MGQESHVFQAEVSRLLDIVAHSLYSNKEIFLRELISNASDACDKLRYAALTQADLLAGDADLKINITADLSAKTITVRDNGIGMSREDLVDNLGTIARSGTTAFVEQLSGDAKKDVGLIGQFGVGFYSVFMVADKVTVLARKAGEAEGWRWESDGKGSFTVDSADDAPARGTQIVLHVADAHEEFLDKARLRQVVKTYSDHIALPIFLLDAGKDTQVNEGSALWARPKKDITDAQYTEFYRHAGHMFDEPWLVVHNRQEGVIEYTNLLFVPASRPFDLFHPERSNHIKLYVKRVFITDDCAELLPPWLRFLRGVVDSEDLPLNISREMLQQNPVLTKIRSGLVKRIIGELRKKAEKEPEAYATFWGLFGAVMKEGIYEEHAQRDALLELARFRSSEAGGDAWISLKDYVGRMPEGQSDIFYITGDETKVLSDSPQLEAFKAKGIEVLLLHDPVDEFWIPGVGDFDGKSFRSVTRGDIDVSAIKGKEDDTPPEDEAAKDPAQLASLTALLKVTLSDAVKDVRPSRRLTNSAVCLVADDGDVDMHLERILRQHKQTDETSKRILEINPTHSLIRRLADSVAGGTVLGPDMVNDVAFLLLDQALIAEGEPVADAGAFARRLTSVMERGLV